MTREEAIKEAHMIAEYTVDLTTHIHSINKIYNDFESRTCENCIWKGDGFIEGSKLCGHEYLYTQGEAFRTFKGFGCNKWEKRDD